MKKRAIIVLCCYALFMLLFNACTAKKEMLEAEATANKKQLQKQSNQIKSLEYTNRAMLALYKNDMPTNSFELATKAWLLQNSPNAAASLLNAWYADIFQIGNTKYTSPMYRNVMDYRQIIFAAQFSPNGKYLIADLGNSVQLTNTDTKKEMVIPAHEAPIYNIGFTSDGRYLYTTSEDFTAKIWDLNGKLICHLQGHEAPVFNLDFSADMQYIASAGWDGTARIWNFKGDEIIKVNALRGIELITDVRFSPDGQFLALSDGFSLSVVNLLNNNKIEFTEVRKEDTFRELMFLPTEAQLVVGNTNGSIDWLDLNGKILRSITAHTGAVEQISFSSDNQFMLTADSSGEVKVWAADAGTYLCSLKGHNASIYDTHFSDDIKYIYTTAADASCKQWPWLMGAVTNYSQGNGRSFLSENKQFVISENSDFTLNIKNWLNEDAGTGTAYSNAINYTFFAPDRLYMASKHENYQTSIWNYKDEEIIRLKGNNNIGFNVFFSPNERFIANADKNGTIKLWDWKGNGICTFAKHTDWISDAAFALNNQFIATASYDRTVRLWNEKGEELANLQGHNNFVNAVAISPDASLIASVSKDKRAILWTADGKVQNVILPFQGNLVAVDFSTTGNTLMIAAENGTIGLWNLTGELLFSFRASNEQLLNAGFSPDGHYIISIAANEPARQWPISATNLINEGMRLGIVKK